MMARKETRLDELVTEAAGILRQLEKLDGNRKLTFESFLAEATELAGTTREKVEKLDLDLESEPGMDSARAFVAKLVRIFREPTYPRCPRDPGKILNAYGSNEAFQQLTGIGATVAQAMAVAVLRVHKKFGNEAFGAIKNWDRYEKECATHRERISAIYEEMKNAVSGLDLDMSLDGLFQEEIARGLCRVSFRREPNLSPNHGDWPQQLVQSVAAKTPIKRERERITKAA